MKETITYIGIVCIIAAIVGGGLKTFDIEFPIINNLKRQLILGGFGVILFLLALCLRRRNWNSLVIKTTAP